ncbi:MAG: hypothetical protein Q8J64_06550 [Thermodesulfovibrionales bacterium]|nr:hypothetical protein [Thermodesulfovibrionales bacterium]
MKISKTFGLKGLGTGKPVTPEQLAKINSYALVPLTAEQVHVRRYLMAHNFIDRDNERFHEDLLSQFAATLPGKGFFVEGHPGYAGGLGPGEGRFFDASTEEMTPERFKELTGESAKLPAGVSMVKALFGDVYVLKLESNADTLAKIDAGIYNHISIGFDAPFLSVTDERGNHIYGEYRPNGEALEGSLVWLGAQPGASAQKSAGIAGQKTDGGHPPDKGGIMKELLERLSKVFGKVFTETGIVDEVKVFLGEKDAKISELMPLAEDGRAYRKGLVDDALKFGTLIGEYSTDGSAQEAEGKFLATLPIDRLKAMRDKFELAARVQFPYADFKGKDETDRGAAQQPGASGGEGPLVKDAKARAEAAQKK